MYTDTQIKEITDLLLDDYNTDRAIDSTGNAFDQLDKELIINIVNKLIRIVYPGHFRDKSYKYYDLRTSVQMNIEDVLYNLNQQVQIALKTKSENSGKSYHELQEEAEKLTMEFFRRIPKVRSYTETDVQAGFDGDPAARSRDEVIFCYPGLYAITVNRLAHELFLLGVPLIPRVMTEHAHSLTGIDIHPGATIGRYFFIDHGTGIVVGETTVIGDYVKIYQGVTLGALSTRGGQSLRGKKRHPQIEDNVTIYAGASILGGDTVIGKNAVIGSNVFITKPVPAGAKVSIKNQELQIRYSADSPVQTKDLYDGDQWSSSL